MLAFPPLMGAGLARITSWLVGAVLLARTVVHVSNVPSSWKTRLSWLAAFGGIGGTIGGAVGLLVDIGSAGLSGGAGTLIGVVLGGSIGAIFSKRFEGPSALLEKGDAFDFLYSAHRRNPKVANPRLVEKALQQIPSFDKNDDGRCWYAKTDLEQFLGAPSPMVLPPPPASPETAK